MATPDAAPPDEDLVAAAQSGSFDAFEQLVLRHERRVYGIAMGILRRREDAEDVVQTTFMNAVAHIAGFRREASFATWIARIATNTALKVLRRRRGGVPLEAAHDPEDEGTIPHPRLVADWRGPFADRKGSEPREIAERREIARLLDQAVEELSEKHRLVFILRDLAGLSVEETARELDITPANVKVRLLRARLALRERLARRLGVEEAGAAAEPPGDPAAGGGRRAP